VTVDTLMSSMMLQDIPLPSQPPSQSLDLTDVPLPPEEHPPLPPLPDTEQVRCQVTSSSFCHFNYVLSFISYQSDYIHCTATANTSHKGGSKFLDIFIF